MSLAPRQDSTSLGGFWTLFDAKNLSVRQYSDFRTVLQTLPYVLRSVLDDLHDRWDVGGVLLVQLELLLMLRVVAHPYGGQATDIGLYLFCTWVLPEVGLLNHWEHSLGPSQVCLKVASTKPTFRQRSRLY